MNWRKIKRYILERKFSFIFTLGSIAFGTYYYARPISLDVGVYKTLHVVLGFLSGKYLGLIFIVLSLLKLLGLILDVNYLKLPIYFALLFLWSLLSVCFFIAFCTGYPNYLWILTGMISLFSTSVISQNTITIWRDDCG